MTFSDAKNFLLLAGLAVSAGVLFTYPGCGRHGVAADPAPPAVNPPRPYVFILAGQSQVSDGEVARRLSDEITSTTGRAVIYDYLGISSTSIEQWQPGTAAFNALAAKIDTMKAAGNVPDAILWMQGESNTPTANPHGTTTGSEYQSLFIKMLSGLRQHTSAPVFVAVETFHQSSTSAEISAAQRELPLMDSSIKPGPDLDALGNEWRRDGTHFTTEGQQRAAEMWREKLFP